MPRIDFDNDPHRRLNPLTGEWVLVSPHRAKRPWQGQQETPAPENKPTYDSKCYLCPGNERANGEHNPAYEGTFVFVNDFAALLPSEQSDSLFLSKGEGRGEGSRPPTESSLEAWTPHAERVEGECRVICFSPRHDLTLANMPVEDIRRVVDTWGEQLLDLGEKYRWIQLFENKGAAMGASNPHPHGQVWASDFIPTLVQRESECQQEHYNQTGRPLLVDVAQAESRRQERVVTENDSWVLLVPFWAVWPFEYLLIPRRPVQRLCDLDDQERDDLASILQNGLKRYDALFDVGFPYSMGWHGAPTDGQAHPHWQLHAHFYPPLLRSATVRKFMVGYEMLAESQRDISPESAAQRLRDISVHPPI